MKWQIWHWVLALLLACSLATPTAGAAEKKATAAKKAPAKKGKTPKAKVEPKAQVVKEPAPGKTSSSAAAKPTASSKPDPAIVATLANELAATRSYRRDASREHAWKLWGVTTRDPGSRTELETHARRMARLRQVLRLAKAEGKTATADRALALIDLESMRHERAMNQGLPRKPPAAGAP